VKIEKRFMRRNVRITYYNNKIKGILRGIKALSIPF